MAQTIVQESMKRTGAQPSGLPRQILFKRKLWISTAAPANELLVGIQYHQVTTDLMNNSLVSDREMEPTGLALIAELAALQMLTWPSADRSLQLKTRPSVEHVQQTRSVDTCLAGGKGPGAAPRPGSAKHEGVRH